jgi:hypothetical protein
VSATRAAIRAADASSVALIVDWILKCIADWSIRLIPPNRERPAGPWNLETVIDRLQALM